MDDLLQHVCGILILFAKILVLQTKPQNRNIYMTCGALTQMFPLWRQERHLGLSRDKE